MNIPNFNETPIGRPPHTESIVCRAITMNFDKFGNGVGEFNSIPFRVREIRVLGCTFDDGGDPDETTYILWCDLFQTSPVSIVGGATSHLQQNTYPNGTQGVRMQFNPAREINGQINFRLTDTDYNKSPVTLPDTSSTACVIMEFVRGE